MPRAKPEVAVQGAEARVGGPGSNGSTRKASPSARPALPAPAKEGTAPTSVPKAAASRKITTSQTATKAKETPVKETPVKENAVKLNAVKENAVKLNAVKENAVKEPVAKAPVAKAPVAKAAVAKASPAKEALARETVVKETGVEEAGAKDAAAKDATAKEAKAPVKHAAKEAPPAPPVAAVAPVAHDGPADEEVAEAHRARRARPVVAKKPESPDRPGPSIDGAAAAAEHGEPREHFLEHQRVLLMAERRNYTRQAEELRAQAEALALEHEPGDVQFDEEGGEGGTANVDRELDLHLSAQAQAAIEEIDAALDKITAGTYGFCESCGSPVPKARLEALPHARLCVSCKSGGLSARRQ